MRYKVKQLIAAILAVGLIVSLFPSIGIEKAYAADVYDAVWIDTDGKEMTAEEKANWEYSYESYYNSYKLTYNKNNIVNGEIVGKVPASIDGKAITSLKNTFKNCTNLTKAPTIPDSVTNMQSTFSDCTNLTEAPAIPDSVTNMNYAFYYCSNLTKAPTIPDSVTNMQSTFYGCTSLIEAPAIPNAVTNMNSTFSSCTNLAKAPIIPNSVINMQNTFSGCTSLIEAPAIPNSVTNMDSTFQSCTGLTQAPVIPNSVTNMSGTFYGCTNLTEVPAIPDSVTNMDSTFHSCNSLKNVTIKGNGITDMTCAFYECDGLINVSIEGQSITNMTSTFLRCKNLKKAKVIGNSIDDMSGIFEGCSSLVEAEITSNSVTNMTHAFSECTSLKKAPSIPNTVTNLDHAFSVCTGLAEAPIIPNSVENMSGTFYKCQQLYGKVKIPEAMKTKYDTDDSINIFWYCDASITGKITDKYDKPVQGATVSCWGNETTSDAQGNYNLTNIPQSGEVTLIVNYKERETLKDINMVRYENKIQNVKLNVEADTPVIQTVSGIITSSQDSRPLSNVDVAIQNASNNSVVGTAKTSSTGAYEVTGLAGNTDYNIKVDYIDPTKPTSTYNQTKNVALRIETEDVEKSIELDIPLAYNVTGTVVNKEEEPVPNVNVKVEDDTGNTFRETDTDNNGDYTLDNLVPGDYEIIVTVDSEEKKVPVVIGDGDKQVNLTITDSDVTVDIPDPDVPLGPTPGTPVDGKVNGNMPVYGTVNPINIIDVTLPISMTFVIKADRTLQKPQDIQVTSNCPAPLNTSILSINKSDTAPDLVAPNTYTDEQWNNLTKAKTYKEIALTLNDQDLSQPGNSLGNLKSAFNAADPSTPNSQYLSLDLDVKYGKAWNNTQDYTFTYNTVFEFSML